jgi:hypothetical protein
MSALKTGLITGIIVGAIFVMYIQGIEPSLSRIWYGPDQADCVRIEGCKDGDVIVWSHSDIQTVFMCEDSTWIAYEDIGDELEPSKQEMF